MRLFCLRCVWGLPVLVPLLATLLTPLPAAAQTGEPGTIYGEFSQEQVDLFERYRALEKQQIELRSKPRSPENRAELDRIAAERSAIEGVEGFEASIARYESLRGIEAIKDLIKREPEYRVPGFDQPLYNSFLASELTRLVGAANAAIAACDYFAYIDASADQVQLVEKYDDISVTTALRNTNTERHDAFVILGNQGFFPKYPKEKCDKEEESDTSIAAPSPTPSSDKIRVGIGATVAIDQFPVTSVGREVGGGPSSLPSGGDDIEPAREFVTTNEDVALYGGEITIILPDDLSGARIRIGYAEGDEQSGPDAFDPGADARLLLPGPEGDESGLSLGGSASFPNSIADQIQILEINETTFEIIVPVADLPPAFPGQVMLKTGYRDTNYTITNSGVIPGFDGAFSYQSELSRERWDAHLALSASTNIFGGGANLSGQVFAGPSVYAVDIQDELTWDLQAVNASGGGMTHTDETDVFLIGGIELGVEVPIAPQVSLDLRAAAEIDYSAAAQRNGSDPTSIDFDRTERYRAAATLIVGF
ncbi:MAG: hypothetical protein AAGH57_12240 [Pseudomonadota bacterium]